MQNLSPVSDEKDIVTKGYVDAVKSAAAINKSTLGYSRKNLLPNTAVSTTHRGVTYTVNDDGTITANGTSTSQAAIYYPGLILKDGKYILSGCPDGGSGTTYMLTAAIYYHDNTIKYIGEFGNGIQFTFDSSIHHRIVVYAEIRGGYTADSLIYKPMIRYADITDDTYEPYVPDVNTRLLALEGKQAQSGELLASTSIGSSGGDITIENLSAYSSAWAYIDGNSGVNFATNVIIPIAYLAKSTSNSVKLAGGIPSAAYITSSGPQAPKDTSAYITAKVSGNVLSLSLSSGGTIGNVMIVAM